MCNCPRYYLLKYIKWCPQGNLSHICKITIINGNVFIHKEILPGYVAMNYVGKAVTNKVGKKISTLSGDVYYS